MDEPDPVPSIPLYAGTSNGVGTQLTTVRLDLS
jgi:hypothetical protein